MVSCFAPLFLAAALGQQAPAEASWLKSIPADVVVAARVKALETGRDDLLKMLEAMSPNAAAMAQPQIEQGLAMFAAQYGKPATQHPFFTIMKLPKDGATPPWAVLVESADYLAVLKSVSGKEDLAPKSLGGYDSFEKADGQTWYGAKGAGFVAFGPDEDLIKGVAKPSAALDEKITAEHKARLLGGDLGVYVNVAAIQAQYADQIEQAKQALLGAIDQAGAQMAGNVADAAKTLYAGLFDSIKNGDALSFNLDFAAAGLDVAAFTTVKPDSSAAKGLAAATLGAPDLIAKLPADATSFVFIKANPGSMAGLEKLGYSFMTGGKPSPELEKGLALLREAGNTETATATVVGGLSTSNVSLGVPKDPRKAVEATEVTLRGLKTGEGMVKDVKITPKAQSYKGFTLDEAKTTFDLEKMVAPGAPGGVEAVRKMLGGDSVTSWFGTDGKMLVNVSAKSFDEAKLLIDAALTGKGSIGEAPGFAAVRKALPQQVNALFLVGAQGLVRQVARQIGSMTGKDLTVPADMPKDPAFFGGTLAATPKGYSIRFTLPSNVGPVLEKGLVPIIHGMQGQIQ